MDAKQSIQEPYSCSSLQVCASTSLGGKSDDNKLEVGNEKPVKFIMCSAAILSIAVLSTAPALAQKKTVKACQEEWQANKAADQANKVTEKAYVAKCRTEGATAQPASAPPAPQRRQRRQPNRREQAEGRSSSRVCT